MSNQVSDQEIEREIQTLRNLRRRSITSAGPGALPLDPDLPPPSPNSRASFETSPQYTSNDDITLSTPDGLDGDGLFWVPAHLHPELAPGEFRAFLKSHTSTDPTHADASDAGDAPGMSRSRSWMTRNPSTRGSEGLGRKRSMLSRQYQPSAGDNVEEERPPLPTPKPVNIYGGRSGEKGLTLEDLQRLEQLVDEAGEDVDPENMRNLLRRSLSMNVAPGFLQDDVPQGDNADAPLVAPRPGSILRRSARTKIRKAGLSGDGGGHRFAATRKGRMTAAPQREIPGLEDDDYASAPESPHRQGSDDASLESEDKFHDAQESHEGTSSHIEIRRDSDTSTDEAHIFDAYVREPSSSISSSSHDHSTSPSPEPSPPSRKLSLPPVPESGETTDWFTTEYDRTPTQESLSDPLASKPRSAEEKAFAAGVGGLSINTTFGEQDHAAPQARYAQLPVEQDLPPGMAPPAQHMSLPPKPLPANAQPAPPVNIEMPQLAKTETNVSTSSVSTSGTTTTKEKKGKFFSKKKDDKEKKGKKDKDRFLGSLFGGKKKNEESSSVSNFSSAGPAAAAALLGTSKSAKSIGAPPSPSPTSPNFQNYARYPIHVERAVYRLSHIKLANARRPLYEQVLISNLMFWYLGILGRNVTEEKKAIGDEKKEEAKPVIKGTPPKPADTGSAAKPGTVIQRPSLNSAPPRAEAAVEHRPTPAQPAAAPSKKSSLSKPERARDGRNSEAPMRAPSYGAQTAQVDHEVRNQMMNQQMGGIMRGPPPQHAQPPSSQAPAGNYPQAHPPSPQQTPRPMASSGPARALSPPSPGVNGPRSPEAGYHRDIPSAARGVPQSSFGPPPAPNSQVVGEDQRDMRQRTISNPNLPHPGSMSPPGGASPRRVVTEGRMPVEGAPRPLYPQRSGPQPGQLFQYPAGAAVPPFARPGSPGPQPGQVFNHPRPPQSMPPQPGQIFQHPQHHPHPHPQARPPHPQYGQRPLPPPGQAQSWEPPQRLPPGASPPQWAGARPPAQQGAPGFDPRRAYPPQSQGQPQGYYGGAGPAPAPGQPLGRPVAVQHGQGYLPAGEYGHHR
ncbi:hypothetical protein CNF01870 [Cryptococcus deneoformans JEC21]|uniref:Protein Zds1 C-terminal domain-containing protein n=1 Tax=Cryptococcus deneoformans (strain JEC21 / ATCC MYA-565) TaxID=214684 RepID=Q5KFG1_CRYD1|nr:hypothetical protein CNF01870 [Cryptococcus neoformans var. neoformans JEC21]AAW44008.2 hypothetical protein CNF01870 [Cryptococcus neoformans var. neoformans JEC21]